MTFTLLVPNQNGAVVGCDSAGTATIQDGGVQKVKWVYYSSQKLFRLGPPNEFILGRTFSGCAAIDGMGAFGTIGWGAFFTEFYCRSIVPAAAPVNLLQALLDFAQMKWQELKAAGKVGQGDPLPASKMLVAAVQAGRYEVETGEVNLNNQTVAAKKPGDITYGGDPMPMARLLNGIDPRLYDALQQQLHVNKNQLDQIMEGVRVNPFHPMMPLHDIIEAVHSLIYSAIAFHRFQGIEPHLVAGMIEIAVVTVESGFQWVSHKPLRQV